MTLHNYHMIITRKMAAEGRFDSAIYKSIIKLGYSELKPLQRDSIKAFLAGNDVFVTLPTGYGKSLCFFCLPLIFDSLHKRCTPWSVEIVISPLSALMHDQVRSLKERGVTAVIITEATSNDLNKAAIVNGEYQVIFTTPELLLTDRNWRDVFQSPSLSERLIALIIDEAHCVKKW